YSLPDFLPGKCMLANDVSIVLLCSSVLYQAPRFIPHTFESLGDRYGVSPEEL
ncbi:hypothetical protein BDP27DRAFT_1165332, partial [Rhodocollybia butyracea]